MVTSLTPDKMLLNSKKEAWPNMKKTLISIDYLDFVADDGSWQQVRQLRLFQTQFMRLKCALIAEIIFFAIDITIRRWLPSESSFYHITWALDGVKGVWPSEWFLSTAQRHYTCLLDGQSVTTRHSLLGLILILERGINTIIWLVFLPTSACTRQWTAWVTSVEELLEPNGCRDTREPVSCARISNSLGAALVDAKLNEDWELVASARTASS